VTLERTSQNKIWQADEATIARAGGLVKTDEIRVSLDDAPPSKATQIQPIRYSIIPWRHFEKLRQVGTNIEILTDAEILGRVARDHLRPKNSGSQSDIVESTRWATTGLMHRSKQHCYPDIGL